jgi:hypothetical protein
MLSESDETRPKRRVHWPDQLHSDGGAITISVAQERWDNAKTMIEWIEGAMRDSDSIEQKKLESYHGYLIYLD